MSERISRIIFAHLRERTFEIQSAEPGHEFERIGEVVMSVQTTGSRAWHCRDQAGRSLLVSGGVANVFPDAWEAAEWLVRYHNGELGQAEFTAGQDLRSFLQDGAKA